VSINDKILTKIEEWQNSKGSLPDILGFYKDLLGNQTEATERIISPQLKTTKAEAGAEIRQGIPLLKWDTLPVDWPVFQELFRSVSDTINEHTDSHTAGLKDIAADLPLLQEITRAWYDGLSLSKWTQAAGVDEQVLGAAIHSTIEPFLVKAAEALKDFIPQNQWRRPHCPVCGGKPDFASLDRTIGARWLLCSRCNTEWLFQRLECPYCDNKDQEKLKYHAGDDELYRLYICEKCKCYLKAIDLRKTESEVLLPFERILTIDMDRQGQEMGYSGGWSTTAPDDRQ